MMIDYLKRRKFIVSLINAKSKEKTCISSIDDLMISELKEELHFEEYL
jgi:hypothetical protein